MQFEIPAQPIHLLHQQVAVHLHLVVCCCYNGSDNMVFAFFLLFADNSFAEGDVACLKAGDYKVTPFNQTKEGVKVYY